MNRAATAASLAWREALRVAELLGAGPTGVGGVVVKAGAGPVRDAWLAHLRNCLPPDAPLRRLPANRVGEALHGSLDIAATLRAGRRVMQTGLLERCQGGLLLLPMAERLARADAACLAAALEAGSTAVGLVALDEGDDDEGVSPVLAERLAFLVDLRPFSWHVMQGSQGSGDFGRPPAALAGVRVGVDALGGSGSGSGASASASASASAGAGAGAGADHGTKCDARSDGAADADIEALRALCATALALGIDSLRAPQQALRVARTHAALDGRRGVETGDAAWAAAWVLAPRATQVPRREDPPGGTPDDTLDAADDTPDPGDTAQVGEAAAAAPPQSQESPESPQLQSPPEPPTPDDASPPDPSRNAQIPSSNATNDSQPPSAARSSPRAIDDAVLDAAAASIPPGLLARLLADRAAGASTRSRPGAGAGSWQRQSRHGRPAGVRRARPQDERRLNLVETLRAAVPWQTLRRAATGSTRLEVRAEDFRVTQHRSRRQTTTIFVLDASGSQALHRLAEAKGAIELLLAECYVRRDRVAVLGFRRQGAELLLPPTRSLTRAKRCLSALPGGGGTPLASALDATTALAETVQRQGDTALVVLLTDARANIARDGSPGRERAQADAHLAARRLRALSLDVLLLDTAPQASPQARQLGTALGAQYLALPHADARTVSIAVRAAQPRAGASR